MLLGLFSDSAPLARVPGVYLFILFVYLCMCVGGGWRVYWCVCHLDEIKYE